MFEQGCLSKTEKQILRPAYLMIVCVVHGAPNARVLRMTLYLRRITWLLSRRRGLRCRGYNRPAAIGGFHDCGGCCLDGGIGSDLGEGPH